jgi:hypothetical protein
MQALIGSFRVVRDLYLVPRALQISLVTSGQSHVVFHN